MLKKLFCLFLALTLICSFAACDDKDSDDWDDEALEEETTSFTAPLEFEEQIIAETDEYLVKVKSIQVKENEWASSDYTLNLYFENNTDKTLYFDIDGGVVNDVSIPGYFQVELPAGKKANEALSLDTYLMEMAGITQVTKVLLLLEPSYYNEEEGTTELPAEHAAIYPEGPDAYTPYVHTPAKEEVLFYDGEDFTIRILDVIEDDGGTYCLKVYFYNKTEDSFDIFLSNSAFNDYLMDDAGYWNTRIYPESHVVHEITWDRNLLEENDIETVDKIWLQFDFELLHTWDRTTVENEFDTF